MKSPWGTLTGTKPQARSPVNYGGGGISLSNAFTGGGSPDQQMRAMTTVGTLFGIVSLTSNATAQVNWRLWRTSTDTRRRYEAEETRTEITRHAALDLWNRPNAFYTRMALVEAVQQHLDLTGEGVLLAVKGRLGGSSIPIELWPIRPDRVTPVPHPTKFIQGYVYTGPGGEKVPLDVEDVIRMVMPNPLDPYRGLGPVQTLLTDLDANRFSAEWNRNFFLNSAEPGGIIELDERLEDDEWETFTERWREQHKGVAAAHRVAVLERGRWVERKYTNKDMQFTELRNLSRELFREAFHIHAHMLGISEDVNKANADAGEASFARWLVLPRSERFKLALNSQLLPMFGDTTQNTEFDHDEVVPEDREADDRERTSKAQSAQLLASTGLWHPDDILKTVGFPAMRTVAQPAPQPVPAPGENGNSNGNGQGNPEEMASLRAYLADRLFG